MFLDNFLGLLDKTSVFNVLKKQFKHSNVSSDSVKVKPSLLRFPNRNLTQLRSLTQKETPSLKYTCNCLKFEAFEISAMLPSERFTSSIIGAFPRCSIRFQIGWSSVSDTLTAMGNGNEFCAV